MEWLDNLMSSWQHLLVLIIATGLTLVWMHKHREAIGLRWLGFRHRNVVFGKIGSMAKNSTVQEGWFHVEKQICQDYKPYYSSVRKNGQYYNDCKRYLDIVGEDGRKPLSLPLVVGLLSVLLLEAWGFSYTLSGFIDLTASENTRKIMAWILAIGFAIALATVTHLMGAELHRNRLIKSVRSLWRADTNPVSELTAQVGDRIGRIDNPSDLGEKSYIQRLNRMKLGSVSEKHHWTISTVFVILLIAGFLTFVRVKALETAQTMDVMCMEPQTLQSTAANAEPNFDDLYAPPASVTAQNNDAKQDGANQVCKATAEGSWATFGTMAILFVMLQAFAIWVSTSFGFAGKHSAEAYRHSHRFPTQEDYVTYYELKAQQVQDYAQKSLTRLQAQMAKKLPNLTQSHSVTELIATANQRTFYEFIDWTNDQELIREANQLNRQIKANEVAKEARKATQRSDEEVRAMLLEEMRRKQEAAQPVETEEEQRARIAKELQLEIEA
ncbi:hypothetical protein [Vibrio sp.]|uniref:hypothetical protein n=1 Tax=Vibrio sp. TaxID=678 RepID=UPI003D11D26E